MDTRRFRHPARSEALAAFRWLGWVMLMMFVLVQAAQAAGELHSAAVAAQELGASSSGSG